MKLIALCGAAGAGKDTVADMLPMRKIAFADALYAEVAEAWRVGDAELRNRASKELPSYLMAIASCRDVEFWQFKADEELCAPRSPRQILQWWGDFRRAQNPGYFVQRTREAVQCGGQGKAWVISDCRFANEVAMVRELGGQLWQVVRPGFAAGGTGHVSDTDGGQFEPDRVIQNAGSLEALRRALDEVVREQAFVGDAA